MTNYYGIRLCEQEEVYFGVKDIKNLLFEVRIIPLSTIIIH